MDKMLDMTPASDWVNLNYKTDDVIYSERVKRCAFFINNKYPI
jgi:hypothetical protein